MKKIISAYDVRDIYEIPSNFDRQKLTFLLQQFFGLETKKADLSKWENLLLRKRQARKNIRIGLVDKYSALKDAYVSIEQALKHYEYAILVRIKQALVEAEAV